MQITAHMKHSALFSLTGLKTGIVLLGIGSLTGCSLVPGQYLGVTAKIDETDKAYVYDDNGTEAIEDRADIYSITPSAIAKQVQERESAEVRLAKLKLDATTRPSQPYAYTIAAQDVLRVTVWNHPELNNPSGVLNDLQGRVVNNDGYFFYPYAGQVMAAGRTVREVRDELAKKLSAVLVEPQVDVSVLTYRGKRAFVMGQVEKPGVVPITDVPLTITDLISQAGGLNPEADLHAATLMRNGKSLPVNLYSLYYQGDISQNIQVDAGDILTIPENRYNKVFVLGEVTKPQSLVMPRGRLSLAEAVSDSGGFNPLSANAGQLYVIRSGNNGKPQIWHLNAAAPDALILADRFDLQSRDIVYVDPAGVARFGRVVNNIIPTATVIRATVQN
ncbi:polysaccharide biosynthesis/export family protein [Pigmentiphaga sp. D-2]|uniref:polysaccharide biosynthesis/export family protein n=1 Tax=Pigmentiphaga sp. D-2 TaxID=1002116 RepID=UPI001404F236|nr:polysaccharide biosynthesis/export family protein [Pigmentiphaga sp. D-2]